MASGSNVPMAGGKPGLRGAVLLAFLLLVGCSQRDLSYQEQIYVFGTLVDISIWGVGEELARRGADAVASDFQALHREWHPWEPGPLTASQAQHHFRRAVANSKWQVLKGWHLLRHSFCSNCARRGVPDTIIDAWMGHRGDEQIKKRYRHLFPSDRKMFMKKLFA